AGRPPGGCDSDGAAFLQPRRRDRAAAFHQRRADARGRGATLAAAAGRRMALGATLRHRGRGLVLGDRPRGRILELADREGEIAMRMTSMGPALVLSLVLASGVVARADEKGVSLPTDLGEILPANPARFYKAPGYSPYAGKHYPERPYFGDEHVHT